MSGGGPYNLDGSVNDNYGGAFGMDFGNMFNAGGGGGSGGAGNLIGGLGGLIMGFAGASVAEQGADLSAQAALQGGDYQAAVYTAYANSSKAETAYNMSLSSAAFGRQQDAFSRAVMTTQSANMSIMGAHNIGMSSGSNMAVLHNNINMQTQQFTQMSNTQSQNQAQIQYQGDMTTSMLQNKAADAQYQGEVTSAIDKYQGEVASWQAMSGAISNFSQSFGGGGGGGAFADF